MHRLQRAGAARSDAQLVVACVLGTDMRNHARFVDECGEVAAPACTTARQRRTLLVGITKAADISNVCRPFEVSRK